MSSRRSERLVNLVIALLVTDRPLTRAELRATIEDYRGRSDQAFERTFERDKDELRAQGIDVRTVTIDSYFGDETGYRIPRSAFELPPVQFNQAEADALAMAARVWRDQVLDESSSAALVKLRAAGVEPDTEAGISTTVSSGAGEPSFPELWRATLSATPVSFSYRDQAWRHVEPWRLVLRRGHWYLLGHDRDRQDARIFRLSRITSPVADDGPAGSVHRPGPGAVQDHLSRLEPPAAEPVTATIAHDPRLRLQTATPRLGAVPVEQDGSPGVPDVPDGYVTGLYTFPGTDALVTAVLRAGGRAVLLGPAPAREELAGRLSAMTARTWTREAAR
ncbi:helix-turn-helix transcriptional regulator [Acidipropionibacterium virtanenii]|uniref:WYL domain-containing protein n=1 Tax=Acidipropionibacterium virtanenii TaxID=2057246 RepID=A0A344UTH6_9ACTN|nr:WYL domain-containing protein [Acidipropionibacterium virtanenii]AXE38574.1 hypothetical protein JS278_01403 [Acidipropionibacterium virtanenii]